MYDKAAGLKQQVINSDLMAALVGKQAPMFSQSGVRWSCTIFQIRSGKLLLLLFFFFKWMTISLFVIEGRRGALRITIEKDDS